MTDNETQGQEPQTRKVKTRWWAKFLFLFLVLGTLAWGIFKFAQEQALQYLCDNIQGISGQPVQCQQLQGSLPGRLSIGYLSYSTPKLKIEVHDLNLRPRLSWLLIGHLSFKDVSMQKLTISILKHDHKPLVFPKSIALPIPIDIKTAQLDLLEVNSIGYRPVLIKNIRTEARLNSNWWNLSHSKLELYGQTLEGRASLQTAFPFTVAGEVQSTGGWDKHQWRSTVTAEGALGDLLSLKAIGLIDQTPASVHATIRLDAPHTVQTLSAQAKGLPLHEWIPHLPQLSGDMDVTAQPDNHGWNGKLSIKNQTPGGIDQNRIPALSATTDWHWQTHQLQLRNLTFLLPQKSRVTGSLDWDKKLSIQAKAEKINLKDFWGRLHPSQLSGPFTFSSDDYHEYRITTELQQNADLFAVQATLLKDGIKAQSIAWRRGSGEVKAAGSFSFEKGNPFDAQLTLQRLDPSRFGQFPSGQINGTAKVDGVLTPKWLVNFETKINQSSLARSPFSLEGSGQLKNNAVSFHQMQMRLDGLNARFDGQLGNTQDKLAINANFKGQSQLIPAFSGEADLNGELIGAIQWPTFTGTISGKQLRYGDWQLRSLKASTQTGSKLLEALKNHALPNVQGHLEIDGLANAELSIQRIEADLNFGNQTGSQHVVLKMSEIAFGEQQIKEASATIEGSLSQHRIQLNAKHQQQQIELLAQGLWNSNDQKWQGHLQEISSTGLWPFRLANPTPLSLNHRSLDLGRMLLVSPKGSLDINHIQWQENQWKSQGQFTQLPVRELILLSGKQTPPFNLALGGKWDFQFRDTLSGSLNIFRESGDIQPLSELKPLGINEGSLDIQATNNQIQAKLNINSQAIGKIKASLQTQLSEKEGRLGLAGIAPINGGIDLNIPSLNWIGQWFSTPGYAFSGTLKGHVDIAGTVAQPMMNGTLVGRQLAAKASNLGLDLKNGEIDLAIEKDRLIINRLIIQGGKGQLTGHGLLSLKENDPDISVELNAKDLAVMARPDQKLTVSGSGKAMLRDSRLAIDADISVNKGLFTLKNSQDNSLDEDIQRPKVNRTDNPDDKKIGVFLNAKIDLGEELEIKHKSFNARAQGILRLESTPQRQPTLRGNVEMDKGTLSAYGQKLVLDTSTLNFNGPPDNPALNLKAYRKNLPLTTKGETIEVGVALTGTARKPVLKLISSPEMTDREKISWIIFGQDLNTKKDNNQNSIITTALTALYSELNDGEENPLMKVTRLDDLSVEKNADDGAKGIIRVGKQLVSNLYISYGKGYNGASDELQLNYLFNRKWSIEFKTNEQNIVDVFYTISFD